MIQIGRCHHLKAVRQSSPGIYLQAGDGTEILLPGAEIPSGLKPGQMVKVFVYRDSKDRLVATIRTPAIMVGQCACLKVVAVNKVGAFLDWGLPKDLLVPFAQQAKRMEPGQSYVVTAYLDPHTDRVVASSRLGRWLQENGSGFRLGQSVDLLIVSSTDLGWKAVINHTHLGLIFHADVTCRLRPGQGLQGFIKRIRHQDQRIDLALTPDQGKSRGTLAQDIIRHLESGGGRSDLSDHATPERIREVFGVSKGTYKKALGSLYRERRIVIADHEIQLVDSGKGHETRRHQPVRGPKSTQDATPANTGSSRTAGGTAVKHKASRAKGLSTPQDSASRPPHATSPTGKRQDRPKRSVSRSTRNRASPRSGGK